jgi:hypothetical protein
MKMRKKSYCCANQEYKVQLYAQQPGSRELKEFFLRI